MMFRHGGGRSPARRLAALPAGSRVELWCGAVYVKQISRWTGAGTGGCTVTSRALVKLNLGDMPTLLVPVASP